MNINAILISILAVFVLAIIDVFSKTLVATIPTFEIIFFRQSGAAILLGSIMLLMRKKPILTKSLHLHIIRACLVATTIGMLIYALSEMPLVLVTAISLTAPIMVAVLSIFFLGEKPTPKLAIVISAGVMGALVLSITQVDLNWGK